MKTCNLLAPILIVMLKLQISNAQLFYIQKDTLCRNSLVSIYGVCKGQESYKWEGSDGITSNLESPTNFSFPTTGAKELSLEITTKTNSVVADSIFVISTEPNGSLTDPDPDVYFVIKNMAGQTIYTSLVNDNFIPPATIYNQFFLQNNETYVIEFWDFDIFDTDDPLGYVFVLNPNGEVTYEFGALKFTVKFQPTNPTYNYTESIDVFDPVIIETNDSLIVTLADKTFSSSVTSWQLNGIVLGSTLGLVPFGPTENGCYTAKYGLSQQCSFTETEPYCYELSAVNDYINTTLIPTIVRRGTDIDLDIFDQIESMYVFNINGGLVHKTGENIFRTQHLSNGLYFIKYNLNNQRQFTRRIIVID